MSQMGELKLADFVKIGNDPHNWQALCANWATQTEAIGEVFDEDYQLQPDVFLPLIGRNHSKSGLYALHDEENYNAVCQLNTAGIPSYQKPVLRVRYVTFAPRIDLANDDAAELYSSALVELFFAVIRHAATEGPMAAGHVHFHLPSPADRQFFAFVGQRFKDRELFSTVDSKGAWLYITLQMED